MSNKIFIFLSFLTIFLFMATPGVWAAGSLSLSPSIGTGNQFSVQVILDTGEDAVLETDLVLNYDPSVLQVTDVAFGDLFPVNVPSDDPSTGKLRTYSYFTNAGDSFIGTGVVATIEFSGLVPGISPVTFDCTQSATNDTNVIGEGSAGDILDCSLVTGGNYTVTAGGGTATPTPTTAVEVGLTPTATLTPTSAPTLTPTTPAIGGGSLTVTPTPVQELMDSGSFTPTLVLSLVGAMLLMGSVALFIW